MKPAFYKLFLLFLLLSGVFGNSAYSHDVDVTGVARIFLDETSSGGYSLSIVDQQVPPLFNIERILPDRCQGQVPGNFSYRFTCSPALNIDDSLEFPWNLEGVVVVARWADDTSISGYFPGDGASISVSMAELKAGAGSLGNLAQRYLVLGAEHILFGIDHLLFILGLLLLMHGFWKLFQTITAFTIAHSITLGFAVLGVFPVPNAPVEVLIALSIVLLAREVIAGQLGHETLVHKKPWIVAFLFGLIHGFGFAGALGELGLAEADIPLALLFFNLGVEAGQVAFILVIIALHGIFRLLFASMLTGIHRGLAYGLGGIACFWFLERIPVLFIPV